MSDYINRSINLSNEYKLEMHASDYIKVPMPYMCVYQVLIFTYLLNRTVGADLQILMNYNRIWSNIL